MERSSELQQSLYATMQMEPFRDQLQSASLAGELGAWTKALTSCVIETCSRMGWRASGKGHECELLPVKRHEYLGIDVMAFEEGDRRWLFPVAAMELENSRSEDKIAYSLWKVLCVDASLRVVFCYRNKPSEAADLVAYLKENVISAMSLESLSALAGETLVVVGSRDNASTFPYGFFKWWKLDHGTGIFQSL